MKRFIIQNKADQKYLKRVSGPKGVKYSWVENVDDALLITTASAASRIAAGLEPAKRYIKWHPQLNTVEITPVGIFLYKEGTQPFLQGKKYEPH